MSEESPVLLSVDARGVATVTLNRPRVGNAYNEDMLRALIAAFTRLAADPKIRALVVRGAGKHFQAGADINWLNEASTYSPQRNYEAASATTRTMQLLNEFPHPTIAIIDGGCFGGGTGIACCVDVALCTPEAIFGITEVRVGVAPTAISTYMVGAIGLRQTRRYAITGERFNAQEACRIGLVHEVVPAPEMEARLARLLDDIMLSGPEAISVTKDSFLGANGMKLSARDASLLSHESWMQRQSAEGLEGTSAFREKRHPSWYVPPA